MSFPLLHRSAGFLGLAWARSEAPEMGSFFGVLSLPCSLRMVGLAGLTVSSGQGEIAAPVALYHVLEQKGHHTNCPLQTPTQFGRLY